MDAVDGFLVHDAHLDQVGVGDFEAPSTSMFDLDGDGILETRVVHTAAGVTVASDGDADGVMDEFTAFQRDGDYQSWEIFRESEGSARWIETDSGRITG